jgi:ketosteroid isomerase-like protein
MIRTSLAALAFAALAATAQAQALTPTDIVNRHMAAAAKGDVAAILGDYADNAVVLTAGKATQGKAAIQAMFTGMLGPGAQKPDIKPVKIWSEGDVGFVSWEMNGGAVKGNDSFVVHDGKVVVQSVFIGETPAQ